MEVIEALQCIAPSPLHERIWSSIDVVVRSIDLYGFEGLALSLNGGKDSTVLLHLLRVHLVLRIHTLQHLLRSHLLRIHTLKHLLRSHHHLATIAAMHLAVAQLSKTHTTHLMIWAMTLHTMTRSRMTYGGR